MYITNSISAAAIAQCPTCPVCPVVCRPEWYIHIYWLGLIFGLVGLASYLIQKKYFARVRLEKKKHIAKILKISACLFFLLFAIYFIRIEHNNLAGACSLNGALLQENVQPDFFHPLYLAN